MKIFKNILFKIQQNLFVKHMALIVSKTSLIDKKDYNKLFFKVLKMCKQIPGEEDVNKQKENIKQEFQDIDDLNSYLKIISNYEEYGKIMNKYGEIENDPKMKNLIIRGSLQKDINFEMDVKLKDVIKGKKLKIEYSQFSKCLDCEAKSNELNCKICNGLGKYEQNKSFVTCVSCQGTGTQSNKKNYCRICFNNQFYEKTKELQFTIGKEFYAGIVYTYPNLGNYDPVTDSYGHLKIKPNIVSDYSDDKQAFFKVCNESQIESEHSATISELALGGSIKITHPTGECEMYLNKCTQPDDYKVVNNVGIPIYYDNEEKQMRKGNMVVVFKLKLPSEEFLKNNQEYRKLFEEMQKFENMEELNEINGMSGIRI